MSNFLPSSTAILLAVAAHNKAEKLRLAKESELASAKLRDAILKAYARGDTRICWVYPYPPEIFQKLQDEGFKLELDEDKDLMIYLPEVGTIDK